MKIKIICVGKIKEKYIVDGINEYAKRLSKYCNLEIIEVMDENFVQNPNMEEIEIIKSKEENKILKQIGDKEYIISLAINGKQFSSEELSGSINSVTIAGYSTISFIIGGSYGLSDNILKKSNLLLSFSKLTFPHQLFRLVLLEQIYRSFKIIKKEPYHKWYGSQHNIDLFKLYWIGGAMLRKEKYDGLFALNKIKN